MISKTRLGLLVSLVALLIASAPAGAQPGATTQVALRWDECYGDGGSTLRTFACNTNSGSEVLMVSAFPNIDMPQLIAAVTIIDLLSPAGALADWWQFPVRRVRIGNLHRGELGAPRPTCGRRRSQRHLPLARDD